MTGVLYTTAGALLMAFISGLAYLAIHYPKTYRAITPTIATAAAIAAVGLGSFAAGVSTGGNAVMRYVSDENFNEARRSLQETDPGFLTIGIVLGALVFSMLVMGVITFLLEAEKEERHTKDKSGE